MDQQAEDIILAIFETAQNDERTRPVVDALRAAFDRGRWTPDTLIQIVEEAITAAMRNGR